MKTSESILCQECEGHIATHLVTQGQEEPKALCLGCRMGAILDCEGIVSEERIIYRQTEPFRRTNVVPRTSRRD